MAELLGLDHLALTADGPTLSMGVEPGQWIALYGPAGSGKSWLIRVLAGLERPPQGSVTRRASTLLVEGISGRRAKPLALARPGGGHHAATIATEALLATRLWDVKDELVADLSPAQIAAAELLKPLTSDAALLLLDGQLDRLDPWSLHGVLGHLMRLKTRGVSVVVASNRPDLAHYFDTLVVLKEHNLRFAGTPEELLRVGPPHVLSVTTDDQPGVRALVAPFSVSVNVGESGIRLEAAEGQELAASLLLEGYGNVKSIIHRAPTIEEALLTLIA